MLWLALSFPRLSIELVTQALADSSVAGAADPVTSAPPVAISNATHVLAGNKAAAALGVQAGIKRATALALAPELKLFTQDARQEQQALESMALTCLQFTPHVSLQYEVSLEATLGLKVPSGSDPHPRPAGLLLELEASLLLFGGRERLLQLILQALSPHGFSVHMASAPYPGGAWLLALHAPATHAEHDGELNARLASLPLSLLKHARPHLEILQGMGTHTLKDLVQLPRAGLARRFGKAMLGEIDQALGKQAELRQYYEAPLDFHQKLELLAEVENTQALLFAAQRLMQHLCQWLALRHAAVRQLELLACHDDRPPTRFEIRLTEPSRDLNRLSGLLRERLNVSRLPAPADILILNCQEIVAVTPPTQDLFPMPQTARENLGRLIERLQIRLGREQVQQVLLARDHRPEACYELRPLDDLKRLGKTTTKAGGETASPAPTGSGLTAAGLTAAGLATAALPGSAAFPAGSQHTPGLPRPLWFLPRPLPISERQNRPFYQSLLHLLAGPERIESGWWDNHLVQRDYFIAEDEQNNLYWLFRQRFPTPGWFIQGRFG